MSTKSTSEIYDEAADGWVRREPLLLSDFTARPRVLERLGDLTGRRVLDLGCGEGYVARLLLDAGASFVHGFDISPEMVARACQARSPESALSATFEAHDVSEGVDLPSNSFDDAIAVFLFNYLTRAKMTAVLRTMARLVHPGGRILFTVPHPDLPWVRPHEAPFFFDAGEHTYHSAVDQTLEGQIWRRDGSSVPVRAVHKTSEDYAQILSDTGLDAHVEQEDLSVTDAHLTLDPAFFGPLRGTPLHVLYTIRTT